MDNTVWAQGGPTQPGARGPADTVVADDLLRQLLDKAEDAYFIFRAYKNGRVSPFLEANPAACRTTGYSREELLTMTFHDLAKGYTSAQQLRKLQENVLHQPYTTMEWVHVNRGGELLPVELSIRVVPDGYDYVIFMTARDISKRKELENALHAMAYFDDKTGLPNRRRFTELLTERLKQAGLTNSSPAVVFIVFDNFKQVNNVFGYNIGDEVVTTAGRRIRSCFPPNCTVSRWGDDEFLVLLPDGDYALQRELLVRMQTVFAQPFVVEEQQVFLTLSAGIAVYPADGCTPEALVQNAGTAVAAAKRRGKSGVVRYTEALHQRVTERLQLASDLRRAIMADEFCVYFQPEVCGESGNLVGMEALVRWQHPQRGLVYPDNFIAVAEDAGLISHIGENVFYQSCTQARMWEQRGLKDYRMAVNLSVLQLQQPDFLKVIDRIVTETRMNPRYCQFEITESVFMHVEAVQDILTGLQEMGSTIAIDDFGTGFSSLSYLRKLPIQMVKVDRSFVRNILTSKNDWVIIKAIVDLAHQLGLQVVAEGVETQEQEQSLRDLGCDFMQGYLYSRPLASGDFEKRFII